MRALLDDWDIDATWHVATDDHPRFPYKRAELASFLQMGGLRRLCKATGMPLLIPTNQQCLEWLIQQGRFEKETVVSYEDLE